MIHAHHPRHTYAKCELASCHFLDCVCGQWLTRAGGDADLKVAIDIKSGILAALDKYKKLNIASGEKSNSK